MYLEFTKELQWGGSCGTSMLPLGDHNCDSYTDIEPCIVLGLWEPVVIPWVTTTFSSECNCFLEQDREETQALLTTPCVRYNGNVRAFKLLRKHVNAWALGLAMVAYERHPLISPAYLTYRRYIRVAHEIISERSQKTPAQDYILLKQFLNLSPDDILTR